MQRRSRLLSWTYVLPVIGAVLVAAATAAVTLPAAQAAAVQADVPPELRPPAGNELTSVFRAHGVQVYGCTDNAWAFVEPAATMTGRAVRGGPQLTVIHFRGPSWQSTTDSSLVEASLVASSPLPGAIPQLLLKARTTRGPGVLGDVTFVQRLATRGGVAPTRPCATGETAGVPYEAVYRFFKAG